MPRFSIDYYKISGLTPDESNAKRRCSLGLWLYAGEVEADSARLANNTARRLIRKGQLFAPGFHGQVRAKMIQEVNGAN